MKKHDLHSEFPEYDEIIHKLKMENNHFKNLFEEYHKTDKKIHMMESNEVYTDEEIKAFKIKRLGLKDELLHMIKNQI
jgi:hypothetical protein